MRLLLSLTLRLVAVAVLCLMCAVGYVMTEANRSIADATTESASRVATKLNALYWNEILWRSGISKNMLVPTPDWRIVEVARLVSPGVCVFFAPTGGEPERLCGQVEGVGREAPAWFAAVNAGLFGSPAPVERPLSPRGDVEGVISAAPDPASALRQAWAQITVVAGVAAAMAAGLAVLAALTIGHALAPARAIVDGLGRLAAGRYEGRLSRFRTAEFDEIALAVNALALRLDETTAERAALTKRLFHVQEEERRALARDLHDEFGQCLAASAAFAASIEAGADGREDLAEDARSIRLAQARMMNTLKDALSRLRSQELDEIGLAASLEQLVASWNGRAGRRGVFRLELVGELAAVPGQIAVHLYRIAQECLTNAARHGRPAAVTLSVLRDGAGAVRLTVEDDGGGDPAAIDGGAGNGLMGIRERVQALGGRLSIGRGAAGLRVAALIPAGRPGLAA